MFFDAVNSMQPEYPILNSYWVMPERLMAGEYPASPGAPESRAKLRWLLKQGINSLLDLTEPGESGLASYEPWLIEEASAMGVGIEYQRIPIRDFTTPPPEYISHILGILDAQINAGNRIYVHCHGGKGRTGMVVGCYLVQHGKSAEDALEQIAVWRTGTPDGKVLSPETEEQIALVMNWRKD